MALVSVFIYRNHTSDDTTHTNAIGGYDTFKTPSEYSWDTPQGKQFVEWNTARDGSGTSHAVGDTVPASGEAHYAIWGDASIDYLTNSNELTSIANAIRTKGGTSSSLTYPTGFVSAIQAIPTGGTYQAKTNITPTTSSQTITPDSGYDALSSVQINAMPSGSATTPATTITVQPVVDVNSNGVIVATNSKTNSVTPTVSAGYVSSGTAGTITISGTSQRQLNTQAAQLITPTTTSQTISSGVYLTGVQTIAGDQNLVAGNIKKDVTIFGVTGNYEASSSLPSANGVSFGTIIITFSIGGNEYNAVDGMTWTQYVNSTYRQPEIGISGDDVAWWGVPIVYSNSNHVYPSDTIVPNEEYTF